MIDIVKRKLVIFITMLLMLTSCIESNHYFIDEKRLIKIGYLPITHAAPLLLDVYKNDGEFKNYKIELVKFSSWTDLMDALNTGRIDGASVLIQLAMRAKEKGFDLTAVALAHGSGNVIISSHDIHNVQDFKNTTFAIPHTYSTHNLLIQELLSTEKMSKNDLNLIEIPPAEMPAALAENRISGYVVTEPFGAITVNNNIGKMFTSSQFIWPLSYCCVIVLRDDFINEHEDITYEFVENYAESVRLANNKSSMLYDALQTYINVDIETLDLSLSWITFNSLKIEQVEYNNLIRRITELNIMNQPPLFNEFVDNRFVDRVNR